MNLRREKFLAVMDAVESGDVATLVVAHKDRLVRFGFDYIEHVAGRILLSPSPFPTKLVRPVGDCAHVLFRLYDCAATKNTQTN